MTLSTSRLHGFPAYYCYLSLVGEPVTAIVYKDIQVPRNLFSLVYYALHQARLSLPTSPSSTLL